MDGSVKLGQGIRKQISHKNYLQKMSIQASAYEKQGRATITRLVMKFRGYRHVKSCTPPTK